MIAKYKVLTMCQALAKTIHIEYSLNPHKHLINKLRKPRNRKVNKLSEIPQFLRDGIQTYRVWI